MIIGLDVGGTHTDVVLLDSGGLIKEIKVHTDSQDLFNTVLEGIKNVTDGINPNEIDRLVLSTTLTTNAIVQKAIPKVGMIVAGGPGIDPEFFRTNTHYYSVSGSIDHRGRRISPVDPDEIKTIGKRFKADGIQYVGITGKFSSRNPSHELEIRKLLRPHFKNIFLGHRVSGNLNFPRRIATTFLNAAVYPLHKRFFEAVRQSLDKEGLKIPIHVLKADGGTMSFESSIDFPGQTILSGPAASTMGATAFAPEDRDAIVLDIGGTTTDISFLVKRVPVLAPFGIELGGYKTLIRSLETCSIGVGGDSAVKLENGEIVIGPERLGFAMVYGGKFPTPTDALAVMGMVKDGNIDKARQGLQPIAIEMGCSLEDAATRIFDQACRFILREVQKRIELINSKPVYTVHELQEGYQVEPHKIMILGGPALYFADHLSRISDYEVTAVPGWKVANAIGAALARTTCEVSLFADTERGILTAPEEKFKKTVKRDFSREDAIEKAHMLLRKKAIEKGADSEDLEMELLEDLQFNMVRGFSTTGRYIRLKLQVKPGLIHGYQAVANKI